MPEPAISAVTSGLNTIIKICEITYALKAVKEQTTALLSTTQHVERNILEAKRLLQQKSELLSFEEKSWMERQVGDTEDALRTVSTLVEAARVNIQSSGSPNMKTKVVWVFRDNLKAGEKMTHLSLCAGSLNSVINALYSKDVVVVQPVQVMEEEDDDARDTDSDGLPNYAMSEFLLRRKVSRTKKTDEEKPPTPPLRPPKIGKVGRMDSGLNMDFTAPMFTVTPLNSNSTGPVSPSTYYGTDVPENVLIGPMMGLNATEQKPTGMPAVSQRQRRSWLIHHASRSKLGHSET